MKYSAIVKDRDTKKKVFIENKEYKTKAQFISDLKGNGYMVNLDKVKLSEVFEYIMNNTNCAPEEWKYINRVPQEGESIGDWIKEGLNKQEERINKRINQHIEEARKSHQEFLKSIGKTEEEFKAMINK